MELTYKNEKCIPAELRGKTVTATLIDDELVYDGKYVANINMFKETGDDNAD